MRDRVPVALEHRYQWAGGHARWLDTRAYPTPDGGLALFWRDVTDRKVAEERVRDSEARFRGVFDSALMGFTIFDAASGETLAINDHFLMMTGHSRTDFEEGRWDWRDFTLPEHLPLDEAAIAQARARGWWDPYEKEYRRRDGTRFPVRISSAPLTGEPGRVIVSVQDMTDARRAEVDLRESEQRLQLAKEAAGIGVWDWDLLTNVITWSPEVYAILGVDPATPADQLFDAWTRAVHPADRDWAVRSACGARLRVRASAWTSASSMRPERSIGCARKRRRCSTARGGPPG
jgi:PAS domain S-box-containing protein